MRKKQPRTIAIEAGEKFYTPAKPCKHGHLVLRRTANGACLSCESTREVARLSNKEAHRARMAAFRAKNPDKIKAYNRKHDAANREKRRQIVRAWQAKHPEKLLALNAKRRAKIRQAVPKWADLKAIEKIYAEARRRKISEGIDLHVDHIIPLRGKSVCGLHVANNLQILNAKDNLVKNNSWSSYDG